ncbi:tRNA (adenosine(37)-N6)-dimethylallyltransferase MiaA [Peptoniphilus catoniae]|uniref:tRNA (adenosine(37)-N6)-dimethylallyltransferase MiaA n=1 Tax=Peptoniphilus catoniae TaxID=1660341 RepID=UPI0010FD03C7|nr:tRNA (adenosine(37)-N6)-dimethylallyltransferase MiaA [Peptoniphilus catoniae]
MDNLLIITGPTGIGKSDLSIKLAEKYKGEIISADSMQIYKGMDIGTAKINIKDTYIKHHMIDIINPSEKYSVVDFQYETKKLIKNINLRNFLPIIVGGTGLYINSIVYNLDFQEVKEDKEYRDYLDSLYENMGSDYLYKKLESLDPISALKIDPANKQRLIRALEINKYSRKNNENFRSENNSYNLLFIGLYMDRKRLYEKIDLRVDNMMEAGLLEETEFLFNKFSRDDLESFKAIGYRELISYLKGEIDLNRAVELIKRNSRRYAKRQLTWFKKDKRIIWINKDEDNWQEKIDKLVGEHFGKK